jgi:hypothetical protein
MFVPLLIRREEFGERRNFTPNYGRTDGQSNNSS